MEHKFSFWHQGGIVIGSLATLYSLALLLAPGFLVAWGHLNELAFGASALGAMLVLFLPPFIPFLYWRSVGFWKGLKALMLCWVGGFFLSLFVLALQVLYIGLVVNHAPLFGTNWFIVSVPVFWLSVGQAYFLSGGLAMLGFALKHVTDSKGKNLLPDSIAAVF